MHHHWKPVIVRAITAFLFFLIFAPDLDRLRIFTMFVGLFIVKSIDSYFPFDHEATTEPKRLKRKPKERVEEHAYSSR
jgi:hypothetical protein